ncbi:MAG: hypothetical protein LBQ14_09780 [Treponema sp.]|jgi:hypothetical protein|nr:hypothetical protein [Treponema sp.]
MVAPERGLETFLLFLITVIPCNKFCVVSIRLFFKIIAAIPCPTFLLFLRYNHQYMTTAKGGGFLIFIKNRELGIKVADSVAAHNPAAKLPRSVCVRTCKAGLTGLWPPGFIRRLAAPVTSLPPPGVGFYRMAGLDKAWSCL